MEESLPRNRFTCAHPVMPHFTLCRDMYQGSSLRNFCTKKVSSGRGPTTLISPCRTFRNCGNSSRLVLRKKRPNGVIRASERQGCWGLDASELFTNIVRNLNIFNRFPLDRKSTPLNSSHT